MDVTFELKGFEGLRDGLRELPDDISRNALRAACGAGAAVVRTEARLLAPRGATGTLKRSIYSKQIRELSGYGRQTFYVGARQGKQYQKRGKKQLSADAFYARFIEFGHFTRPAGGGRLARGRGRTEKLQAQLAAGQVHWVPPQPFLRPAFESKKEAATGAMAVKLRERLERFRTSGK